MVTKIKSKNSFLIRYMYSICYSQFIAVGFGNVSIKIDDDWDMVRIVDQVVGRSVGWTSVMSA